MSSDYQFRPDLKGRLSQGFAEAEKLQLQGDARAMQKAEQVQDVERRAAAIRANSRSHFERMKPRFVERELAEQKRKHPLKLSHSLATGPKPPVPMGERRQAHDMAMRLRAESAVNLRQQARLHAIDRAEQHMVRQILRTRSRIR